jgi:hypothetical protein
MIHQAKSNPQLLDEQIFSERLHPRFCYWHQTAAVAALLLLGDESGPSSGTVRGLKVSRNRHPTSTLPLGAVRI